MTKIKTKVSTGIEEYIPIYSELQLEEFFERTHTLYRKAKDKGYTNVYFTLESTLEPYEDWPGDVLLTVYGDRPKTQEEIEEEEKYEKLLKFAKEKGITPYEAGILLKLKEQGRI